MSKQLSIPFVEDSDQASSTEVVEDDKRRAIQRFLDRAEQLEPKASVGKYSPNGRKIEYFRLLYRVGKKVKAIHIRGGNTSARLANYRAKKLQDMIDRGAELAEVLEQLADFNSGKI